MFADLALHFALLADRVRTLAYREAIAARAPGEVVLELGCGSGILALFAARAGARRVFAVERSGMAQVARLLFRANGAERQVELLRGDSRTLQLPEPATLLVHELLGSDPFDEGLLPLLDDARARHLVRGAQLLPERLEVLCQGFTSGWEPERERRIRALGELESLYGVDLSPLAMVLATERGPERQLPTPALLADLVPLTEEVALFDLDLARPLAAQTSGPRQLQLPVLRAGSLSGVLVTFRASLGAGVLLSNSAAAPPTHWEPLLLSLPRPLPVLPGARAALSLQLVPEGEGHRLTLLPAGPR